jgi:DNA-binding transcriptional ArsR family regulator
MNLSKKAAQISTILKTISPPTRLAILLAIGEGEACVCHLEAVLGQRQAYISQHLMALRQAEILLDRRDGRFIYYRIANPALLRLVQDAGKLAGIEVPSRPEAVKCMCPQCSEGKPGYLPISQVETVQLHPTAEEGIN